MAMGEKKIIIIHIHWNVSLFNYCCYYHHVYYCVSSGAELCGFVFLMMRILIVKGILSFILFSLSPFVHYIWITSVEDIDTHENKQCTKCLSHNVV